MDTHYGPWVIACKHKCLVSSMQAVCVWGSQGVKGAQGVLSLGSGQPMAIPYAKIIISMRVCFFMPAKPMLGIRAQRSFNADSQCCSLC